MTPLTGGCLCGRVRYTLSGPPVRRYLCHCRDCQRASGSAFTAAMMVRTADLAFTGPLAGHPVTGASGDTITRHFCPTCGANIINTGASTDERLILHAGSLDDPTAFTPDFEIYCASAQPWTQQQQGAGQGPNRPRHPGPWLS